MNNSPKTVICDLDNTLYDWVTYFVTSFEAMVDELVRITRIEREVILDDFRAVHQKHGNSEHPFAVLELECLLSKYPDLTHQELAKKIDRAMLAFNRSRKATLNCYDDVVSTLAELQHRRVKVIAHTDSDLHAVIDRLTRLEIVGYFDAVYCREPGDTRHPQGKNIGHWNPDFPIGKVKTLPRDCKKPAPQVIDLICNEQGLEKSSVAYVGDSISRDMMMAKEAGVEAIWAKYGVLNSSDLYDKLVRVSHWTEEDVRKEKELSARAKATKPDIILETGFGDLLSYI